MEDKKCYCCKYACGWDSYKKYGTCVQCARYPEWTNVFEPYDHWCGEWEAKENT